MLADGVIEKSNASYYSHPVIVQKTEGASLHRLQEPQRLHQARQLAPP